MELCNFSEVKVALPVFHPSKHPAITLRYRCIKKTPILDALVIVRLRCARLFVLALVTALVMTLSACSGSGSSSAPPPATLTSISATAAASSVVAGLTDQLAATGTLSNGSISNVTSSVSWASQNTAVATVSPSGLVTGKSAGTAVITATSGSVTGSVTVTVTAAQIKAIVITPASPSLASGLSQQLTATATFTDGSTVDITNSATWSSSVPAVAAVSTSGRVTGKSVGAADITATSGSISGSVTVTVTAPVVVSITVTPASPTVTAGFTQQFHATATLTDGSTKDITSSATWSSAATSVATVDAGGLATTLVQGAALITAAAGSVSGSATLQVGPPVLQSITITPGPATLQIGASLPLQLTATGNYSNKTTQDLTDTVQWSAVNTLVASVSATGQATPSRAGYTTVTATDGSISASDALTVLATPRYLYTVSDAGRDASRLTINSSTGQARYAGYLQTGDTNNVGFACLTLNPSRTYAYLSTQISASTSTGYAGQLNVYAINQNSGLGNQTYSTSSLSIAQGCIEFAPDGKFAYAISGVNNAGNQLGIFSVNSDGSLTLDNTISFSGIPAGLAVDPLGQYLYVDVLQSPGGPSSKSSVYGYSITPSTGALTALNGSPFPVADGTYGNLTFHPSGNVLYVADSNGNTVSAYTVNRQTGALSLSPVSRVVPCTNPIAAQISPDGSHLYTSCPVALSTILAYTIANDGSLTLSGSVNAGGSVLELAVDPSGQYLYASMPDSDTVKVYKLGANGSIAFDQKIAGRNNMQSLAIIGGASPVQWTTNYAYVTSAGDNSETGYAVHTDGTLSIGTSVPTGTSPFSPTLLPWDTHLLLAAQAAAPNIDTYSVTSQVMTPASLVGTQNSLGGVVIDPESTYAYASDPANGLIYVYANTLSWGPVGVGGSQETFTAGAGAGPEVMDPSGRYLFVANQTEKSISLIQPAGAAATPNVALTYTPLAIAPDASGNFLFVDGDDSYLHMLVSDGKGDLTESANAVLSGNMQSIAVDPTASFVYTAGAGGLQAFSFDPSAQTLSPIDLNLSTSLTGATGVYIDPSGQFLYVSVNSSTTKALYLFTINSDGTLTSSPANPVATPNNATGMVFQSAIQ